jgi:ribonucrease Y
VSGIGRDEGLEERRSHLTAAEENATSASPEIRSSEEESQTPGLGTLDDLGASILNLLHTAQEDAAQLVVAAKGEAQAIRENAEKETSELRDRLESEMQDRRQQLTVLRAEADSYAEDRRGEADREASRIRADVEAEVIALRREADATTRKLEEAERRRQELIDASRALEDWLSGTISTFQEVVEKLGKVLQAPPAELDETLLQEAQSVADGVDRQKA